MLETDAQLRERHLAWLDRNAMTFAEDAPRPYLESGRGAYVVTTTTGPPILGPLEYWTAVEELPDTEDGRHIARMIREYDPTTQVVVVFREPDYGVHAYRFSLTVRRPSPN